MGYRGNIRTDNMRIGIICQQVILHYHFFGDIEKRQQQCRGYSRPVLALSAVEKHGMLLVILKQKLEKALVRGFCGLAEHYPRIYARIGGDTGFRKRQQPLSVLLFGIYLHQLLLLFLTPLELQNGQVVIFCTRYVRIAVQDRFIAGAEIYYRSDVVILSQRLYVALGRRIKLPCPQELTALYSPAFPVYVPAEVTGVCHTLQRDNVIV